MTEDTTLYTVLGLVTDWAIGTRYRTSEIFPVHCPMLQLVTKVAMIIAYTVSREKEEKEQKTSYNSKYSSEVHPSEKIKETETL